MSPKRLERFVDICGEIMDAIEAKTYNHAAFSGQIAEASTIIKEAQQGRSEDRLFALRLKKILTDLTSLANCAEGGRKWNRLAARIEKNIQALEGLAVGI